MAPAERGLKASEVTTNASSDRAGASLRQRPPLRAFHLETEPRLFTFDKQGRVAARLEGSFGVAAFREAVEAALESSR